MLANILTGDNPCDVAATRAKILLVTRDVNGVRTSLRDIVAKAMEVDPQRRYVSAQAFIDALRPFSDGE